MDSISFRLYFHKPVLHTQVQADLIMETAGIHIGFNVQANFEIIPS